MGGSASGAIANPAHHPNGHTSLDAIPGAGASIRIGLLGRLTIAVDGVEVQVGGPVQRRLMTVLAVAALDGSTPLTVSDLIDTVYGENLPPRPRRSLATLVWRLRHRLGSDSILFDGYTYRLAPGLYAIDAVEFDELVHRGRALARRGDDAEAVSTLHAALALWRDPWEPEPEMPGPGRARLVELRLGAMDHLASSLARSGKPGAAIDLLEQVVAVRPAWEHSQAQLVDRYLDVGDAAGALRVHDSACRVLAEQGVEPGVDLERAAARLAVETAGPAPMVLPRQQVSVPTGRNHHPGTGPLVGRDIELEQLTAAIGRVVDSRRPAAIIVSGEPGIGKSTLVGAALSSITGEGRPLRTVVLACDPRQTLPYAPLAGLLTKGSDPAAPLAAILNGSAAAPGTTTPAATDVITGVTSTEQIHAALADEVRAVAEPGLVLLIEDLQWAPSETIDAVATLLTSSADLPIAVVATSREPAAADLLASSVYTHVRLKGLAPTAIADLIGSEPEAVDAEQLHRLTGGNPLYLHHVRQAGPLDSSEVPGDLATAIENHLRQVPTDVLDVLEVAAVAGGRFELGVLTALAGALRLERPAWIDRLSAAARHGLVRHHDEEAGRFSFVHSLIHQHLYARMPAQRRTAAHAEVGRALDRMAIGRPFPADLLAHHYTRGWPETTTREVVDKVRAAAGAAAAQLDFDQAVGHYRIMLDHLAMDPGATNDREIADTIGAAARTAAAAEDLTTAQTLFRSQRSFAESTCLPSARISAVLGILNTETERRARPQIAEVLASVLTDVAEQRVLHEFPELAAESLAVVHMHHPHRADRLITKIAGTEPELVARLHRATWEHRTAPGQLAAARLLVDDPHAQPVAAWLRLWISEAAVGLRALDDPPQCRVPLHHADDRTRSDLAQWRVTTLMATGRLDHAKRLIERALAAPRHPDPAEQARRVAGFSGQGAFLALVTGDVQGADRSARSDNPLWTSRHPNIRRYISAFLLAIGGKRDVARELCDELLDEINEPDIPESDLLPRLTLLSDACLASGHRTALPSCLQHLLPHRGQHAIFHFGHYWGVSDLRIGRLQVALGDLDTAVESLRDAVVHLGAAHADVHLQTGRRHLANALLTRGHTQDRPEIDRLHELADAADRTLGLAHRRIA